MEVTHSINLTTSARVTAELRFMCRGSSNKCFSTFYSAAVWSALGGSIQKRILAKFGKITKISLAWPESDKILVWTFFVTKSGCVILHSYCTFCYPRWLSIPPSWLNTGGFFKRVERWSHDYRTGGQRTDTVYFGKWFSLSLRIFLWYQISSPFFWAQALLSSSFQVCYQRWRQAVYSPTALVIATSVRIRYWRLTFYFFC